MTATHAAEQKTAVAEVYRQIAGEYDERIPGVTGLDERFAEAELAFTLDRVEPTDSVLDIGCGTGRFTLPLARKAASVVGFDISADMLRQADQKLAEAGLTVDLRQGDMAEMPFEDGQFNVVVWMMALMHIPLEDRQQVFDEVARVLAPGGRLVVGVKNAVFERLSRTDRFATVDLTDVERKELVFTRTRAGQDLRAPWFSFSPEDLHCLTARAGLIPVGLHGNIPLSAWLSETMLDDPAVRGAVVALERALSDVPPLSHLGYHLLLDAVKPRR
jgi:ubiquinone/menaquinone biosynthesis C-methylase UbiE